MSNREKIIQMRDVEVKFTVRNKELTAIREVSLDVYKGEILSIVGESGSGKSVLTKTLTGMLEENGRVSGGEILYKNKDLVKIEADKQATIEARKAVKNAKVDSKNRADKKAQLEKIREEVYNKVYKEIIDTTDGLDLRKIKNNSDWLNVRGIRIATIFQDQSTSLNPLRSIGSQITEVIIKHRGFSKAEAKEEAIRLLDIVGIPNARARFKDYPFRYSGGMRQRVVIAIALACQPEIIICDEPTTALDVTIQAQIIDLIKELAKEIGFTVLFITHDLGVVANVADRVAVMYAGQIVEYGTADEVFYNPQHPYTWALLSSLPQLGQKGEELYAIVGTPPSLYHKIEGDAFALRNPNALKIDFVEEPPMFQISETHFAKTWLLDDRAPKVKRPEVIEHLSETVAKLRGDL